jgi:hypothetical protein
LKAERSGRGAVHAGADAFLDLELFLIVRQKGEIIGKLGGSFCGMFSVGYGKS